MAYRARVHYFNQKSQPRHRGAFVRGHIVTHEHPRKDVITRLSRAKESSAVVPYLPAETMAEIFKYCQLMSYDHSRAKYKSVDWCWMTLTHVCKFWRTIALRDQELWAHIGIKKSTDPARIKAFLERSGISPLYIHYADSKSHYCAPEIFQLLLNHIRRIRELHIEIFEHSKGSLELISSPAPQLEKFTLLVNSDEMTDVQNLFERDAPKLTDLSLHHVRTFTWEDVPIMQNLRCLHFSHDLRLQDLFTIIPQISNCEQLSIDSLRDSGYSQVEGFLPGQIQPYFQLPKLKNLDISSANYSVLSILFRNVDLPSIENWNVVCNRLPLGAHQWVDPARAIPHTSESVSGPLFLRLVITFKSIKIIAKSLNQATYWQQSVEYWWGTVSFFGEDKTLRNGFAVACSAIEGHFWCSATELTVDMLSPGDKDLLYRNVDSSCWRRLLNLLPHVRKLTVRHVWANLGSVRVYRTEAHLGLLSALGSRLGILENTVICPQLSELILSGFDLRERGRTLHVVGHLKYRNECGKQLELLRMTDLLPMNEASYMNLHFLRENRVARTVEAFD